MAWGHGYKADYDYVELMVEQRENHWRLTLRDNRYGEEVVHEDEFATAGGVSFLAREHVAGRTLQQALQAGPMDTAAALDCARQIAGALRFPLPLGCSDNDRGPAAVPRDGLRTAR